MLLEAAIFLQEEVGCRCVVSEKGTLFHVTVLIALRLTHMVVKGIGAERLLVTPLLLLLEAAIFFPEEVGGGCAVSAECLFFHVSVFVTLRLTHAVIKGIGAENNARITRGELQ